MLCKMQHKSIKVYRVVALTFLTWKALPKGANWPSQIKFFLYRPNHRIELLTQQYLKSELIHKLVVTALAR
jgi:hypothetical protein